LTKISVALFGKSELAVRIADWLQVSDRFDLRAVVPTRPQPSWCHDLGAWADSNGVPCVDSGRIDDLTDAPDMALSIYYNQIFKPHHLTAFRYALNVHNSALPKHRGMKPIEWSMLDGSQQQGVTVHDIEPGIDTGDIYGQVIFRTWPHQTSHDIHAMCMRYAYPLVVSVLTDFDHVTPVAQEEAQATYHFANETPAAS
jgi:methionyl-tRNA formyltransferase